MRYIGRCNARHTAKDGDDVRYDAEKERDEDDEDDVDDEDEEDDEDAEDDEDDPQKGGADGREREQQR